MLVTAGNQMEMPASRGHKTYTVNDWPERRGIWRQEEEDGVNSISDTAVQVEVVLKTLERHHSRVKLGEPNWAMVNS